jgi:hypothetical protein
LCRWQTKSGTSASPRATASADRASRSARCFLADEFGLRVGLTTLSFLALAAAVIAYLSSDTRELASMVRLMQAESFSAATPDGSIEGSFAGSGPSLLLLHGGPAMTDYMDMLDAELDGWRSIRYQQRGLPPSAVNGPSR